MTEQIHEGGPERDPEFFAALTTVFSEYPEAARRYAIARTNHSIDPRGGEESRTGVLRNVEEGQLLLEFVMKPEEPGPGGSHCYLWEIDPESGRPRCAIWYEV